MSADNQNDSEKWESICCRCGRCCYEKVDFEGQIYYTEVPCEFLDTASKLCHVYAGRDVKRPGCVRLTDEILKQGVMPADCPYVADIEDYPAPTLLDDGDSEDS